MAVEIHVILIDFADLHLDSKKFDTGPVKN